MAVVVAVDLLGVQAEALGLFDKAAVVENVGGGAVQLVAVVIEDIDDVVQLVGIGEMQSLPDLALVGLAVADDAENVVVPPVDPVGQRRAGGRGDALAQRAGGQIHAGGEQAVGVAGGLGVGPVEGVGLLDGIVAHQAEGGIGHRSGVALGQHQPVPVLPAGILGVEFHDLAVENGHQVRKVHGAAHVAEAQGVDDLQRFQPDLRRQNFALLFIHGKSLPFCF